MINILKQLEKEITKIEVEQLEIKEGSPIISAIDSGFIIKPLQGYHYAIYRTVGVGYKNNKLTTIKKTTLKELIGSEEEIKETIKNEELNISKHLPPPIAFDGKVDKNFPPTIIGLAKDSSLKLFSSISDSIAMKKILKENHMTKPIERNGIWLSYIKIGKNVFLLSSVSKHKLITYAENILANAKKIKGLNYPVALTYAHLKAKLSEEWKITKTLSIFSKNRETLPFR